MTTIANKHGLKKAAQERTAKHAQRTPLPPKQETIAMVEEALREAAAAKAATADSPSMLKAKAFLDHIKPFGWAGTAGTPEGVDTPDHIEVTARRGGEVLRIEWIGGVCQNNTTHVIADRVVKVRNASAARALAARAPEAAQQELERVANNRAFRKRETPDSDLKRQKLPFDVESAGDGEVANALAGRKVRWHNRYREVAEDAIVSANPRMIHFTEFNGERIVNFLCPHTGYRALRLVALLSVGRGVAMVETPSEAAETRKSKRRGKAATAE